MGTKGNNCRRGFGGCVGMERLNGAVEEKQFRIGGFTEIPNFGFIILAGCTINEIHGVTRYDEKHNFSDYC